MPTFPTLGDLARSGKDQRRTISDGSSVSRRTRKGFKTADYMGPRHGEQGKGRTNDKPRKSRGPEYLERQKRAYAARI